MRQTQRIEQANTKAGKQVIHTQPNCQFYEVREGTCGGVGAVVCENVQNEEKYAVYDREHGQPVTMDIFEDGADHRDEEQQDQDLFPAHLVFFGDLELIVHFNCI